MGDETDVRPKPMIQVGNRPIVWHVMKIYSHFGYRRFVLCLGYKGDMFRDYFLRYHEYTQDFIVRTGRETRVEPMGPCDEEWEIVLAETGLQTTTGGRMRAIAHLIDTPHFLMTYGDGVADVDIDALVARHHSMGRVATLTAVHPSARFGELDTHDGLVRGFAEKPERSTGFLINGGFFVLQKRVFDYIQDDVFFEAAPLTQLAQEGELSHYTHRGFWQCMDTPAERDYLNEVWESGAPWALWDKECGSR
ncbi:MAG: glucose-1-phosphate cytidylyltransferase [Armatimonadetes bacterium]|nr:glucose-1-phosphate cytidylyltransferase [Armatimonadota bacterium]